jgi:hypothetical protein
MRTRHLITLFFSSVLAFGIQSQADAQSIQLEGKLRPHARFATQEDEQIDFSLLRPYFDNSQILPASHLNHSPYVLSPQGEHLMSGRADAIYARGIADSPRGTYWQVVHIDKTFKDPISHHTLGTLARATALAKVAIPGNVSKLWLSESQSEIRPGDRLLPPDNQVDHAVLFPYHPELNIDGSIVGSLDDLGEFGEIGRFHTVIINRGEHSGLHPGALLTIYKPGNRIIDHIKKKSVRLPDEATGQILIYRVFAKASMGLVLNTTAPIHQMDKVST